MSEKAAERVGVCNLCEAACGLLLTIEDGRVTRARGNPDDPLSRGHICPKGVALGDVHADPDRLRRPVRRIGDGEAARWEEMSWDEALDLVADRLAGVVREHGRDAVAVYLGNPNAHSLGSMTHGTALVKSLRTRNPFSATSVDQLPHQLIGHLLYGHQLLLPVPDIDRTSLFVVIGGNPMASNGSLMTVPDFPRRLRALQERGGRMVVLDPRRTETAQRADEHHFVRPGTDAWVLLAVLRTILDEGLATPPAWLDDVDDVRAAIADFTPDAAERASGVPAATIERLAREIAAADGAAVYGRMGVSTQEFGLVCQWAVQLINLVTGNVDREGGMMLTRPAIDIVGRGLIGRGGHARWRSRVRQAPETGGELPVSVLREEMETPGEGQVRALLTIAGNPVLSTPDGAALDRAMDDLDFMVSIDIYLNETTRHADVILPPTTLLERDHYDLVFHALAVRDTARFTPALLPKGRDQRHDWQIFRDLHARLQQRLPAGGSLRSRLTARARMSMSPTFLVGMLLRTGRSGVTLTDLRRTPQGVDLGPLTPGQLPQRLFTRDKRVRALPGIVGDDLARLRTQQPVDDGRLLLIGRRHQRDCNSWLHNTERLTRGQARHHLLMHPGDLAERGLVDGATVTVTSRVGSVQVEVRASEDVMRGVVSLPHGYGHQRPGANVRLAVAESVVGVSINDLTDPERLDVSGNAALSGVPVTVA
ncbi:molybdopterin-dependent oxidoreductase [Nocardioides sp.]|uniref:molybdopterin-dependent oxidoreductase n=1 Tax=Nocardioides sp. TaxID=35761 RepID=UPI00351250E1